MDENKRYEFLWNEINSLKRDGTKISDDTRKALIHDISEKSKEGRIKILSSVVAIMTIIISLITYIGFKSVEDSTANYIAHSQLKNEVLKELSNERVISNETLDNAKNINNKLLVRENKLNNKINDLIKKIDAKEQDLEKITNIIAKLGISNKDISKIIDNNLLYVLNNSKLFSFTKSFGLSDISVIKLLASESESFNFSHITQESISMSIKDIQDRYDLTLDGRLGPCTSLVIGSLLLERFGLETRTELMHTDYGTNTSLVNAFQACSKHDKTQIQRYLDYPDLPLHSELNAFVSAAKIDRNQLLKNLAAYLPDMSSYKALNKIGYEEQ